MTKPFVIKGKKVSRKEICIMACRKMMKLIEVDAAYKRIR